MARTVGVHGPLHSNDSDSITDEAGGTGVSGSEWRLDVPDPAFNTALLKASSHP